ncbi:MAG: rhodanese-like domain-containing protein [Thermoplasmata archaeon]
MRVIDREEIMAKMDREDPFKLVMVMNEWHFEAAHIPGSILVTNREDAAKKLRPDEEIVVYCSDDMCSSSHIAADRMERAGFEHVLHYKGGLKNWSGAGFPLEGSLIQG